MKKCRACGRRHRVANPTGCGKTGRAYNAAWMRDKRKLQMTRRVRAVLSIDEWDRVRAERVRAKWSTAGPTIAAA